MDGLRHGCHEAQGPWTGTAQELTREKTQEWAPSDRPAAREREQAWRPWRRLDALVDARAAWGSEQARGGSWHEAGSRSGVRGLNAGLDPAGRPLRLTQVTQIQTEVRPHSW